MSEWSDISQAIGMLGQQDVQRKQKAYYDTQLQATQQKVAEEAAVSQNYNALAQAFHQSGGNIDALAPMVKDGASMQAMAKFVDDYSKTEEGRKKAMDATAQRAMRNFQVGSGYISKALSAPRGSEEWAANIQNAAAVAPFSFKLGGYDPESQSFELLAADPVAGFRGAGERISADQAEGTLKRIASGTIAAKDGTLFNKEWQDAQIMFDLDRKQKNAAALTNPDSHLLLTNGAQSLTVIPQLSENPADGYVYLVQDPQKGLVPTRDLNAYLSAGFRPVTQKQVNEETKQDLERSQQGIQMFGHQISATNAGLRQLEFEDGQRGQGAAKNQVAVLNTVIDNLRAKQNDILKRYVKFPEPMSGETQEVFMARMSDATKTAAQALESAAAKGDPRAAADWEQYQNTQQEYGLALDKSADLAFGMTGIAAPTRMPGAQAGVLPAAKGTTEGRYRAAGAPQSGTQAQPAPPTPAAAPPKGGDNPPVQGARKAPDGNWYVEKDGKYFRVKQ